MQRLVNSIYRSTLSKILSNSITRRVSSELFVVTKYRYSRCPQDQMYHVFEVYDIIYDITYEITFTHN